MRPGQGQLLARDGAGLQADAQEQGQVGLRVHDPSREAGVLCLLGKQYVCYEFTLAFGKCGLTFLELPLCAKCQPSIFRNVPFDLHSDHMKSASFQMRPEPQTQPGWTLIWPRTFSGSLYYSLGFTPLLVSFRNPSLDAAA